MAGKDKIYLPPLTKEGLKKRIEELVIANKQKELLNIIENNPKMKTIWELAIQLSFIVMGGNSKQKGANTV